MAVTNKHSLWKKVEAVKSSTFKVYVQLRQSTIMNLFIRFGCKSFSSVEKLFDNF